MASGVDSLLSLPSDIAAAVGDILGSFSMGSVVPKMGNVVAPVETFVKKFIGQINQLLGPFQRMTDLASHFVNDFDPALVADLGRHFRDLNAVVGVVLRPIVDVARDVVKSLSSYLLPAMRQLEPLVREMADVVGDQLMAGFRDLGAFLHALMPTFSEAKDLFVGLVKIVGDFRPVFEMFGSVFMQMVREIIASLGGGGGSMKEMMIDLRRAVQSVIVSLVQFAASLMQAFGWTRGIEAMRKALTERANVPNENAQGMAVLLNPMFKSISEMGRSMQQSMFAASAAGGTARTPQEETNDLLEELIEAVNDGAEGGDEMKAMVEEQLAYLYDLIDEGKKKLEKLEKWYDDKSSKIDGAITDISTVGKAAAKFIGSFTQAKNDASQRIERARQGIMFPIDVIRNLF